VRTRKEQAYDHKQPTPPADAARSAGPPLRAPASWRDVLNRNAIASSRRSSCGRCSRPPDQRGRSAHPADTVAALKVDEDTLQGTIAELTAAGTVATDASEGRITDAGAPLYERITKETSAARPGSGGLTSRGDLLATGSVKTLVAERAKPNLAAVSSR